MDDVVFKGMGFSQGHSPCVPLEVEELGVTNTHAVLAFLLAFFFFANVANVLFFDVLPLDSVTEKV